jgi:putative FmdB family regulatory protein
MPTFEYKCPDCDQYFDSYCKIAERKHQTHEGCVSIAKQVIRTNAALNWTSLAMGASASPEAISHFDKVHKDQVEKEEKAIAEHGSIN